MIRIAFSTIACPDWTLERVARVACELGYDGIDLRSEGHGGGSRCALACDPGLTGAEKVRSILGDEGIEIAAVATDLRFDAPIRPPLIGHALPEREHSVRLGRHLVELASDIGAELVRVFPLRLPRRERRDRGLRRICERLAKVCDHARNRDVQVAIENEGSFASAWDLIEIMDRVGSPLLSASYNLLAAVHVGDDLDDAVRALGSRLSMVRLRDVVNDRPVPLGEGELPAAPFVSAVADISNHCGTRPWAVVNWDRAGADDMQDPETALAGVVDRICTWAGGRNSAGPRSQPDHSSAAPSMTLGF